MLTIDKIDINLRLNIFGFFIYKRHIE